MIDEQEERKLVEGLIGGHRESFAAVYDAYGGMAYGFALRLLGSPSEAEDVVQESFLALWRQASRIDVSRGLRSYLLSIVHNRSVDRVRSRARRPETELDLDAPLASAEEDPADQAVRSTEGARVRAAMKSLSSEQQQTVEYVYFRGLTIDETAKRMGAPSGTVKSRLRLALGHLRQELDRR